MIIRLVKFETELSEEEVLKVADERIDPFRSLPGLVQKYYVKPSEPNQYGGVYIWKSREVLAAYRESDLASSIAAAYKVKGVPVIETMDVFFPLRD